MSFLFNRVNRKEFLAGFDPLKLRSEITDFEGSALYRFITTRLQEIIDTKKRHVFNTIEADAKLLDHNRNVVTIKTLESVLELFKTARDMCDEELKKGEGHVR